MAGGQCQRFAAVTLIICKFTSISKITFFRFITDRRIFIAGFGLYGSIHGPAEYDVSLQLIQTTSGNVIGSNHTNFSCDGTNYTFRVMFKTAIEIQPNISYMASVTLKVKLLFSLILI